MKLKRFFTLFVAVILTAALGMSMVSCDIDSILEGFALQENKDLEFFTDRVVGQDGLNEETETAIENTDEGEFGEPLDTPPKMLLAKDHEMLIATIEKNIELKINMGEIEDAELERFRLATFKSYYGRFDLNEAINPEMRDRLLTDYPILQVTGVIYVLDPAISSEQLPLQAAFMSEYVPAANKFVAKCYNNVEEAVRNSDADNQEELMTYVQNVIR